MHGNHDLPTKESVYHSMEMYPYVPKPKDGKTDYDDLAIRHFIGMMYKDSKVVLEEDLKVALEKEEVLIVTARLAHHEIEKRLGDAYYRNAAYYDASALPFRIFYRGSKDGKAIRAPLEIFGRRGADSDTSASRSIGAFEKAKIAKRQEAWDQLEKIQEKPAFGPPLRRLALPTHVAFPRCLHLMVSPPSQNKSNPALFWQSPIDKWLQSDNFVIETERDQEHKLRWTEERILLDPKDALFSHQIGGYNPDRVQVNTDDRRNGSPSSPLVTLLRRDIIKNGVKIGHPAFFFLRIEKVEGEYVPWRGPPRPPPPPGASAGSSSGHSSPRRMFRDYSPPSSPNTALSLRKRSFYEF